MVSTGLLLELVSDRRNRSGAGEGNRTLVASLEDWSSTIELHPRNCSQRSNHTLNVNVPRWPPPRPAGRNLRLVKQRAGLACSLRAVRHGSGSPVPAARCGV